MKLCATNEVGAESKFWYFLRKLKKVKISNGQVLAINEIYEKIRHRVRSPCIQIIKTATIPAKLRKRESTKQFHKDIKFLLVFQKVRPPTRRLKTTYKARGPNLFR
ncbi:hypothetical protein MKX01_041161 [Papaver californicum]|nr:hypothetical protein MKX01_041161 [Papaver californicum]